MKNRRRLKIALRLFALWFVIHVLVTISIGLSDRIASSDAALVFGNKVEESGEPSERLIRRLRRALDLYQAGIVPNIVVSGAIGVEGHDESTAMKDWLVAQGIPPSVIIQDGEGKDTESSARRYGRLASDRGWSAPIIVTDYFHILRARLALRRAGFPGAGSAHAPLKFHIKEVYYIAREFFAFYYYLVRFN